MRKQRDELRQEYNKLSIVFDDTVKELYQYRKLYAELEENYHKLCKLNIEKILKKL